MFKKRLPRAFESAVNDACVSLGIYEITTYGWLNEWDEDPDYEGHALWQTAPPADWLQLQPMSEGPVLKRPSDEEIELAVAGEDFVGLMQTARLCIGLAKLFSVHADDHGFGAGIENRLFWLHYTHALMTISMAAERLRAFFVRGYLLQPPRSCGPNVFDKVRDERAAAGAPPDVAAKLSRLADEMRIVDALRKQRNELVHRVGTVWGRQIEGLYVGIQERFDHEQKWGYQEPDWSNWQMPSGIQEPVRANMDERLEQLAAAYKALVEASNVVFLLENEKRREGV
jgi:hypothetical protein